MKPNPSPLAWVGSSLIFDSFRFSIKHPPPLPVTGYVRGGLFHDPAPYVQKLVECVLVPDVFRDGHPVRVEKVGPFKLSRFLLTEVKDSPRFRITLTTQRITVEIVARRDYLASRFGSWLAPSCRVVTFLLQDLLDEAVLGVVGFRAVVPVDVP